jgi:hypothetical protein
MTIVRIALRTLFVGSLISVFLVSGSPLSHAQDFESQAKDILKLYEQGRTDTAYWLIEPLKKNARFVPAALYVRAQMTPDDRALNLYREVIALEPGGAWADESAYQLVKRYIGKADSLAAWTWFNMLQKNYPQSPYLPKAETLLKEQKTWELYPDEDFGTDGAQSDTARDDGESMSDDASETSTDAVSESDVEVFEGYALQVGVLPTEDAADRLQQQMNAKGLGTSTFPKDVDGKTMYAVVVGPYESQKAAQDDRGRVRKACGCGAFVVIVEP